MLRYLYYVSQVSLMVISKRPLKTYTLCDYTVFTFDSKVQPLDELFLPIFITLRISHMLTLGENKHVFQQDVIMVV